MSVFAYFKKPTLATITAQFHRMVEDLHRVASDHHDLAIRHSEQMAYHGTMADLHMKDSAEAKRVAAQVKATFT